MTLRHTLQPLIWSKVLLPLEKRCISVVVSNRYFWGFVHLKHWNVSMNIFKSEFLILISENIESIGGKSSYELQDEKPNVITYAQQISRTCIARTLRNRLHSCVCTGNCTMAGRGRTTHPPSVALAASQLSGGSTYIAAGGRSSTPISRLFQKKTMAAESIDTNCMTLTRYF